MTCEVFAAKQRRFGHQLAGDLHGLKKGLMAVNLPTKYHSLKLDNHPERDAVARVEMHERHEEVAGTEHFGLDRACHQLVLKRKPRGAVAVGFVDIFVHHGSQC